MRKISLLGLALAALLMVSCQDSKTETPAAEPVSVTKTVGISKFVSHPALDAVEQGIQDELKAEGLDVNFDLQNANADSNSAASIAAKFKSDKVDIAVGIATPTAQALVQTLTDIPVIFSAVTDPVSAGLVTSLSAGNGNVSGLSDMSPVKEQIAFLVKLDPSVKTLGMVYTGGEANAVVLEELAAQACKDLGLGFVPVSIVNSAEVKSATESIVGKVDAFYIGVDNTVVSAIAALTDVAATNKKPVMSADPSSAHDVEVLAAWGFDYYKMGRATGRMIGEIFGGTDISTIPTRFMTDVQDISLLINLDSAAKLGITIPEDLVNSASTIIKDGMLTEK